MVDKNTQAKILAESTLHPQLCVIIEENGQHKL